MTRPALLQLLLQSALVCLLAVFAHASNIQPPVVPLVVRNPYLSTWMRVRDDPWTQWPIFWTGQQVGMSVMVAVPRSNTVFPLLGRPQDSLEMDGFTDSFNLSFPSFLGTSYDASTTNLTYRIPAPNALLDDANITLSFLSPITPESSLRQSVPASYISVTAEADFDIGLYIDVNGDWVSGDANSVIEWSLRENKDAHGASLATWEVRRQQELHFTEHLDRAEWGRMLFTAPSHVQYQAGSSTSMRKLFAKTHRLNNDYDLEYRAVNEDEPAFGFAYNFALSSSNASSASVDFTLAHIQDEIVQYASARGLTLMRPLWKSFFLTDSALLAFHFSDIDKARKLSGHYSSQLESDAHKAAGSDYVDIVSLSARQVLGATSFSGTPENPLIFLKEISSNGNTQTVDVIFPAWPFFSYTSPRWLAYLLEPLLEHQLSGQYPNKYSMHDLGAHFPNLTGHADGNDEYMPVEECGDMLIMGLSLVNSLRYGAQSAAQSIWSATGVSQAPTPNQKPFALHVNQHPGQEFGMDNQWGGAEHGDRLARKWLQDSYPIWKQWSQYLIEESLEPKNQLCTDDFAGWLPLQTNLALKGIVGIRAMGELAGLVGHGDEAAYYRNVSDAYIAKWQDTEHAMSLDHSHAKLAYDWYGSWTTLYSLYADAALCFHSGADSSVSSSSSVHNDEFQHSHPDEQKPIAPRPHPPRKPSSPHPFIPSAVYANQSRLYELSLQKFGLPLDSRHLYAKSDWMLEAAAVASPALRRAVVARIARWLRDTTTDLPFSDLFDTEGDGGFGAGNRFTARPVVGGHFSLLALARACRGADWGGGGIAWAAVDDDQGASD